jgi:hypothetical protein
LYNTLIEGQNYIKAFEVDPVDRLVYWIDENTIKRAFIPVTRTALGQPQNLIGKEDLTALAIDWLGKNLYFAEGINGTISVSKSDGRYARVLISKNAEYVKDLVVNPVLGLIFWINTDSSNVGIYSAYANGQNAKLLISTNLDSPSGLAIDYFMENRIFWADSKTNIIESCKFDGSDRASVMHVGLVKPFRIDIFENHIYWLSEDEGSINKVDKFGRGAAFNNLVGSLEMADDIKVYHSYKIPTSTNNPCSNGTSSCSHLCLLKPNNDFECVCPDNSKLVESDLFTCDAGKSIINKI